MNKKVRSGIEIPMPKTIREAIDDPAVRGSVTELGERLAQEALDDMSKESKEKESDAERP